MTAVFGIFFIAFIIFLLMAMVNFLRKNKPKLKRNGLIALGCFVIAMIAVANSPAPAATTAATDAKPAAEVPVEKEAVAVAEPAAEKPVVAAPAVTDWKSEISKIASGSDGASDKASAAEAMAMKYVPADDELKEFEYYIQNEFKSGKYLTGLTDDEYALTNIFKSLAVQRQYKEFNESTIGDFAFDFYQNSKYVYRGVDAPDSEAVKSNEQQMNNALAELDPSAAVAVKDPAAVGGSVTITKAEYDQVKDGMSYAEAAKIIGGEGEVLSESGSPGDDLYTIMVMYYGDEASSIGANANFMFQGDKLINKAQMGLK